MKNSFLSTWSAAQLRKAADLREKIETFEDELAALLGVPERLRVNRVLKKKRTMSAAARKRISQATKARWARLRAAKS